MGITTVSQKVRYRFQVLAIKPDSSRNVHCGIVRFAAQQGAVKIAGLGTAFVRDASDLRIIGEPFFYSSGNDLQANFRRPIPRLRADDPLFYFPDYKVQGICLPLPEMHQEAGQQELTEYLMEKIAKQLPAWLARLKPGAAPSWYSPLRRAKFERSPVFSPNIVAMFYRLSSGLDEKSLTSIKDYFEVRVSREKVRERLVELPPTVIIYTPTGGLPRWARDYQGRRFSK